jgi:hypothetical protein
MNKQEALDKIEELKKFVEEYDKPKKTIFNSPTRHIVVYSDGDLNIDGTIYHDNRDMLKEALSLAEKRKPFKISNDYDITEE